MKSNTRWDNYHMSKAELTASQSKDPNTKVGAVIIDAFDREISSGFNGLPRGIEDSARVLDDRELKLMVTIHAEINAILFSHRNLSECSLYTTHIPCSGCAALIIQSGIGEVIAADNPDEHLSSRWQASTDLAKQLFDEAGVIFRTIPR